MKKEKTMKKKTLVILMYCILLIMCGCTEESNTDNSRNSDDVNVTTEKSEDEERDEEETTSEDEVTTEKDKTEIKTDEITTSEDETVFGADNSAQTDEIPQVYRDIIEQCISAYPWSEGEMDSLVEKMPELSYVYFYHDDLSQIGYTIIDIDNNGTDELIIGPNYDENSDYKGMLYDMYTINENEVVHILSGMERDRYYLGSDNSIINEGSGSAFDSTICKYVLDDSGTELALVGGISYNRWYAAEAGLINDVYEDEGNEDCYFVFYDTCSYENFEHIPQKEGEEKFESYKQQKTKIVYTPLTEYTYDNR